MQSIFVNKWNWIEWEWYDLLHNIALKFGLYLFDCLGVVQLLNKLDGTSFNKNDENLFEVFLYFFATFLVTVTSIVGGFRFKLLVIS